jgi:RNA polymerase-binding transcription factor DksA
MIEAIERDLNDVDTAMDRLEKGTYFSDEVTGAPLRPEILATNPLTRRNKN